MPKHTYDEVVQKILEIRGKISQIQNTPAQGDSSYRKLLKDLQYYQHIKTLLNKSRTKDS